MEPVERLRKLDDGRVEGITEEGDFFVARLRLNRAALVRYRAKQRSQHALEVELRASRARVRALAAEIASLSAESVSAEVEVVAGRAKPSSRRTAKSVLRRSADEGYL